MILYKAINIRYLASCFQTNPKLFDEQGKCLSLFFTQIKFPSNPQCPNFSFVLTNYCQTLGLVLRLRVDFVLPLSQEQEEEQEEQEQEEEPTPKFIRRGCTRRLKFDA